MKIKKLLAVGLAAIAGATLTAGAITAQSSSLGDYVATSDGTLTSPMVVIGSTAGNPTEYPKDVVAAADLAAHLAGFATTPVTVSGVGTTSVSGGVNLATPARALFVGSLLNRGKDTLTDRDLPVELASGVFTDDAGASFDYDQFIDVGGVQIKFDDSGGDLTDPELIVDLGTSSAAPYMTFRLDFTDPVELNATDSEGNSINIFGTSYTIDPETTGSSLILQGGGTSVSIDERSSTTVVVDGVEYEVEVKIISAGSSVDNALISVNGVTDDINEGVSKTIGGLTIFADLLAPSGSDNPGVAVLLVGGKQLTLTDGQTVLEGESDDVIENTLVTFTKDGNNWESIKIDVGAQDSNFDHLSAGDSLTDPVFEIVKIAFNGIDPSLADETRNLLTVRKAGDDEVTINFKDFNGDTMSDFPFAFDSAPNSPNTQLVLTNDDGDNIVVVEGNELGEDDFFITSIGDADRLDFSHLWEVTSITALGTNNAKIRINDKFSGRNVDVELGSDNSDQKAIDGKNFFFNITDATNKKFTVTWEDGAGFNDTGNEKTIFPILQGHNGEKIAIVGNVSIGIIDQPGLDVGDKIKLPTGELNITSFVSGAFVELTPFNLAGTAGTALNLTGAGSILVGQHNYSLNLAATDEVNIWSTVHGSEPGILVVEEENDNNEFHTISILTGDNNNGVTIDVGSSSTNAFTDGVGALVSTDNSDVQQAVTEYGTFVEEDKTDDQGIARVSYGDFQSVASVAIGADPVFSTQAGGSTVESAILITNPIAKLDNEISSPSTLTSDLILVGGPCANNLVAQLAADNTTGIPACDAWTLSTGLIKEVTDAFGSGQKALVIAGTTADDTRSLASQVMQGTLAFEA